jgi:hypothetical protein
MHAVSLAHLEEVSREIAVRIVRWAGVDVSSVALDMTNFRDRHRQRERPGQAATGRPAAGMFVIPARRMGRLDLDAVPVCGGRPPQGSGRG